MKNFTISTPQFYTDNAEFSDLATLCTDLWNRAMGDTFAISSRVFAWQKQLSTNTDRQLWLAKQDDTAIGFMLSSLAPATNSVHIDALAVVPEAQRQGVGRHLIDQLCAITKSAQAAFRSLQVGGGAESLLAGVPTASDSVDFFAHYGFRPQGTAIETRTINVATYQPPAARKELPAAVRPAQVGQQRELSSFLHSQPTPGHAHLERALHHGRRLSDLMVLWTEAGIRGICQLGFEDSPLPIELSFPYPLPRPWAQIGTIALHPELGDEYLALLLDASLRRLHNTGVNSAVITTELPPPIHEQFALEAYHSFHPMHMQLK